MATPRLTDPPPHFCAHPHEYGAYYKVGTGLLEPAQLVDGLYIQLWKSTDWILARVLERDCRGPTLISPRVIKRDCS